MNALEKAINLSGGALGLSKRLGPPITRSHIYYWRKHGVPLKYVDRFEIATDNVITRLDLRPDFYGPESLIEAMNRREEMKEHAIVTPCPPVNTAVETSTPTL